MVNGFRLEAGFRKEPGFLLQFFYLQVNCNFRYNLPDVSPKTSAQPRTFSSHGS
jgi:hypothetical protein